MAQSIEQLKAAVRGQVIQPEDAAYEAARKVYNGMIDKRPKLIVRALMWPTSWPPLVMGVRTDYSPRFAAAATTGPVWELATADW